MGTKTSNAKLAGLSRFTDTQKADSLRRLREAAMKLFGESGYVAVSIDDIAREAGVTRKTFYRHFAGKAEIAIDLFEAHLAAAERVWGSVGLEDWRDPRVVRAWLDRLIDHIGEGVISRTVIELGLLSPEMKARIRDIGPQLTAALGEKIPAFSIRAEGPAAKKLRAKAALLVHQILDQGTQFVSGLLDVERGLLIDLLAEAFEALVAEADAELRRPEGRKARG